MNRTVFIEELRSLVIQRSFVFLLIGATLIHAFLFVGSAGLFDGHSSGVQSWVNSSFEISKMGLEMNKILMFLVPVWVGSRLLRDFESGMDNVLYSYPISKSALYFSKFLAGVIVALLGVLFIRLVPIFFHDLNGLDPGKLGSLQVGSYISSFFQDTLPIILLASGLIFYTVARSKSTYSGFVILVCLLLWQKLIQSTGLSANLMTYLDPFFETGFYATRRLWTLEERNTASVNYSQLEVATRIIWTLVGLFFLILGERVFNEKTLLLERVLQNKTIAEHIKRKPRILSVFKSLADSLKNLELGREWTIGMGHVNYALSRSVFWILTGLGLMFVVFVIYRITEGGDLKLQPAAHVILGVPSFFYSMIITLITFIFSGLFFHRARINGMNGLIEATGVRNFEIKLGQLLALLIIQIVLLGIFVIGAIALQLYHGYWENNWIYYIVHVGLFMFPGLLIWAMISQFVHHVVNNFYMGVICLLLFWLGLNSLGQFGMNSRLWQFNYDSPISYSQLSGYDGIFESYCLMKIYWFSFVSILSILMSMSWRRGARTLMQSVRSNYFEKPRYYQLSLGVLLAVTLVLGAIISNEESKTFEYQFGNTKNLISDAQRSMGAYTHDAIPQIVGVDLEMDIFPSEKKYFCKGRYRIVNRSELVIDTFVLRTGFEEVTKWDLANSVVLSYDSILNWYAVELLKPLEKGDTLEFEFQVENIANTFFQRNSPVVSNGTFIKSDILPRFGPYNLMEDDEGIHHGHYQGLDSDLVDYSCAISTSADQIPLTVGNLIESSQSNGRTVAKYHTNHPIKFGFSFHSGAFEKSISEWRGKEIYIYHIPEHKHGVKSMIEGLKCALEYNTRYFSDYPHDQISVVQFPKTDGSYATAFGNLMPTSEVRFLLKPDSVGVDLGFYVPAHEITHNWWGNELIPANNPGAHFLTESLTEYCTYQIYEDRYGEDRALNFIKTQHRRYFRGLSLLEDEEVTLIQVDDSDSFLSYGKGAIALRYLAHLWGEDNANHFLKTFLEEHGSGDNKYAFAEDWYVQLQASVPDSISKIAEELFESVCLRNVAVEVETDNDSFLLNISYKPRCTTGSAASDWLEIGWYQGERLIKIQRLFCHPGMNQFELEKLEGSDRLIIDPEYYWLDRDRSDNEVSF